MGNYNDLVFLPSFSIEPGKCTSFNRVFHKSRLQSSWDEEPKSRIIRNHSATELRHENKIVRSAHNFQISDNAYRTLKRRINWLYYLSKARYVKTYSGREIFNFKIGFVTFTLPSKQQHCTKDVTNLMFNTLLTELRQRTKMTNYVWRLEFQKNGNVHYHLVTDTYLDYWFVQKIWNRIIANYGYIDAYQAKFGAMSLSQYRQAVDPKQKQPFDVIAKRYAKGKKHNWSQPNSVDVKSVVSKQKIANYISKYFSKDGNNTAVCNSLDNAENSENLRLWFCSRSLSKLNTVSDFCEAVEYDIFAVVKACKRLRTKFYKYATVFYFDFKELGSWGRQFVEQLLRGYARSTGYFPSQ